MAGRIPKYRIIVLSRRLKILGVLDTMSEQIPEVTDALAIIESQLGPRIAALGDGDWKIISHSHSTFNGILLASFPSKKYGYLDGSPIRTSEVQTWMTMKCGGASAGLSINKG